jgi:eukaryotic-like serine/threonine-protein kinase
MPPPSAATDPEATVPPAAPAEQATLPPADAALTLDHSVSSLIPGGVAVPGYEIMRELGRGGMGVVYQARHLKLGRVVALKMILTGGHAGKDELARFLVEGEAIARLQHPNIVQIYEVGECGGLPFFSLEFCPGGSLDAKLAGTPMPPREAAQLVETLARAMQAAHDKGVVHRDLKPANVLLADGGAPKITDFGLAKKLDNASGRTNTGAIMGTPSYMAPEQAEGKKDVGPAADTYALGAILYECLTGRPPFKAATALDTIMQVAADEPVPPRQLQPTTPRDLETICLKCLQKEPGKRYASAAALADDLRAFQAGEPIRARPVAALERATKWVQRNPAVTALATAVVAALLLGTGVSTVFGFLANANAVEASHKADDEKTARTEANANALKASRKADDEKAARTEAERQLERAKNFLFTVQLRSVAQIYENNPQEALVLLEDTNACPKDHRDLAWRFYEQSCHRGVLLGHAGPVKSVALSGDGKTLASGSDDMTVKVWDVGTGKVRATLGHTAAVASVALSRDGKTLVSGSYDGTINVWDVNAGKVRATSKGHADVVTSVALSGDGKNIVSGGADKTVKVWDVGMGQERATLKGHEGAVLSVALSGDGKTIVSGSEDKTIKVWDVDAAKERATLKNYITPVASVALSGDGKTLVSAGSFASTVKVWDVGKGKVISTLKGYLSGSFSPVNSVALSGDGKTVVSGSYDNTVKVWDVSTGQVRATLKGHAGWVNSVALSTDGKTIVSGSQDKTIKVWALGAGQERAILKDPTAALVQAVTLSRDGKTLVSGSQDGTIKVWDLDTGKVRHILGHPGSGLLAFLGDSGSVSLVALSGDGKTVVSGSRDNTIKIWDVEAEKVRVALKVTGPIMSAALSGDGKTLISTNTELVGEGLIQTLNPGAAVKVWYVDTGKERANFKCHADSAASTALSEDGKTLVTGGNLDGTIYLWDVDTGKERGALRGHTSLVSCLAWSADGKILVSGSYDNTVKVWHVGADKELATFKGHTGFVVSVALSGDGKTLVSESLDGTIKFWDVGTGQEHATLRTPSQDSSLAMSGDGKTLVSVSAEGMIKVWLHGGSD